MTFLKQYWPGLLLFAAFLIIGLLNYQEYGVSVDELWQTQNGEVSYNYISNGDTTINNYWDKDHGVGFELPLVIIEKKLNITDYRDIFLFRHIASHIFFLTCMLFGYFLIYHLFKNQFVACAGFVMLVFNPRLYAHSFFNSKDIPSLSVLVLIFYASYWAFRNRKLVHFILLGAACGYAMSIRLTNLMIPAPLFLFFIIDIVTNVKNKEIIIKSVVGLCLFIISTCVTLYVCWPMLWANPVKNLIEAFDSMAKYRWEGDVLVNGVMYTSSNIPWHFIPSWFVVTVPEIWLITGLTGIVLLLYAFIKKPIVFFKDGTDRNLMLYLYCFVAPVAAVVYLKSVLYDDWRHLYFIYLPFIILACFGLNELLKTKLKSIYKVVWLAQLVYLVYFVANYYPHEYIYFNHLTSHKKDNLMRKYELDYWGITHKAGLEWVLTNTADDSIYVNDDFPIYLNIMMLTKDKRKRFFLTKDNSQVEYYMENYRLYPLIYPEDKAVHQISVSNSPVLRITKLR